MPSCISEPKGYPNIVHLYFPACLWLTGKCHVLTMILVYGGSRGNSNHVCLKTSFTTFFNRELHIQFIDVVLIFWIDVYISMTSFVYPESAYICQWRHYSYILNRQIHFNDVKFKMNGTKHTCSLILTCFALLPTQCTVVNINTRASQINIRC